MNGGLETDGAIVDCRSALISAAQGCCLRELASSSALKSLSLPRRDETKPGNPRASLYSCSSLPAAPTLSPHLSVLCSCFICFLSFFLFFFAWWSRPTERVPASASLSPLQTASGELEVSSGRREKVAVGCSAGPEGVGGQR